MWLITNMNSFEERKKIMDGGYTISTYNGMVFKRKITGIAVYYSLWDGDRMIGYMWTTKVQHLINTLRIFEFCVADDYQSQGIGTEFFKTIVVHDRYCVISDYTHTEAASRVWKKLWGVKGLGVSTYNSLDDSISWVPLNNEEVYSSDNLHFIAYPHETNIPDSLSG
jgi:GNAT superfamily N-acetyltransferase